MDAEIFEKWRQRRLGAIDALLNESQPTCSEDSRLKIVSSKTLSILEDEVRVKTAILKFFKEDLCISEESMLGKVMCEICGSADPKYVKSCIAEYYSGPSTPT